MFRHANPSHYTPKNLNRPSNTMCGITVSIALDRRQRQPCTPETRADLETKLSNSLDLIAHRGPDAKGIWINEDASIGSLKPHDLHLPRY